jgi:GxxExxY protein
MDQSPEQPRDFVDDPITKSIIGAAIDVHRALGPGLLESAYQVCLAHELRKKGHQCETEVPLPVTYDGLRLDCGYRMDLVVDDAVVVEVKSVEKVHGIHEAQLLTYLRLSGKPRGLLINFNEALLKNGLHRRALTRR